MLDNPLFKFMLQRALAGDPEVEEQANTQKIDSPKKTTLEPKNLLAQNEEIPLNPIDADYNAPIDATTSDIHSAISSSYVAPTREEKEFEAAYKADMENRRNNLDKMRIDEAEMANSAPSGMTAVDLSSALAFADQLAGTKGAQAYKAPTAKQEHKSDLEKLKKAITDSEGALSDDQLAYLKMKAAEAAARARVSASMNKSANNSNADRAKEFALRNEWSKDPITKNSKAIAEGWQKIQSAAPIDNKASDLSLVYGLMRLQDPQSVVRESEAEMAQNIGGFPAKTQALFSSLVGNGRLAPAQREAIIAEATNLYNAQLSRQKLIDDDYKQLAANYGFNPKNVVLENIVKPPPKSYSEEDKAAIAWAKANPNSPEAAMILKMHGGK